MTIEELMGEYAVDPDQAKWMLAASQDELRRTEAATYEEMRRIREMRSAIRAVLVERGRLSG